MTAVIGIDPGIKGAIAFVSHGYAVAADLPLLMVNKKNQLDVSKLHRWLTVLFYDDAEHIFLERAQAMPGQGVSSMFNYGRMFGQIEGLLVATGKPYTLVQPAKWKRDLQVQKDKDAARARASQLLPHMADQWPLKKHDGRAEAALIALWGQRWLESA